MAMAITKLVCSDCGLELGDCSFCGFKIEDGDFIVCESGGYHCHKGCCE